MRYLMVLFMFALLPLPALAADTITFDFEDGASWVSIEGDVSGGVFSPVYVAGGNSNASSGQGCAGSDNTRCFLALSLAWSNAYSNATGPTGFTLTSTDGAVRLSCSRGPVVVAGQAVPMAVHSCSTAWQSGAVWATPTECSGPQGADLGGCVGYAYAQSH